MNERTNISLPTELVRLAERKAAEQGRTLTELVEEGVRQVVGEKKPVQKPRGKVPVSSATGGFNPGFENMTYRDIQQMDDIEYAERMRRGFK
jgi:hypothetical protein